MAVKQNSKGDRLLKSLLPREVWKLLRRRLWGMLDLAYVSRSGINVRIDDSGDWIIFKDIFLNREYDKAILNALTYQTSNRTVEILDLGANIGMFSLRVLDLVEEISCRKVDFRITAVEGHPQAYATLVRNISLQDAKYNKKIRLVQGLVGAKKGIGKIYDGNYTMNSSTKLDERLGKFWEVPYIDITGLYETNQEYDLIKCDVEGSEGDFITEYADLLRRTKALVIEFHMPSVVFSVCRERLRQLGLCSHTILRKVDDNTSVEYFTRLRDETGHNAAEGLAPEPKSSEP
jgi:FkbM family methyltransferase